MRASLLLLVWLAATPAAGQDMPADYAAVLKSLNKTGDFKGAVLKVNILRSDVTVAVQGVVVPTPFGFGGWMAMTRGDRGMDVMMGDLVLTESEINQAGTGTELPNGPLDVARLAKTIGHAGEQNASVYKITVGRPDIDLREHGARIDARMGLNTWAAFAGSDDQAVVAGDVAMRAAEVTPVLKALRTAGIQVVALHHHMTTGTPVFFAHYWGRGDAASLARGVRAALDVLPKQ